MADLTIAKTRKQRIARTYGGAIAKAIDNQMDEMIKKLMESIDRMAKQEGLSDKDHVALRMQAIDTFVHCAQNEAIEAIDAVNPYEI